MRQFNVFSPVVVVAQNETFQWIVTQAELGTRAKNIIVEPLAGSTWPLDQPSYTVTPSAPASAKVTGNVGSGFTCNTPPNNIASQKIVVTARAAGGPCAGTTVAPGDYLIWTSESANTMFVAPDPANPNYWPLPQPQYAIPPNGWIAVAVPAEALNGTYTITVTDKAGEPQCTDKTQPIIIVQSNGGLGKKH